MNRFFSGLIIFFLSLPLSAATSYEPLLNRINLQFSADKWITTSTPLVSIAVDATVNDVAMGDLQKGIYANLEKIVPSAEWHITSFNRTEDPSGLEKIEASAEARVSESALSGLRDRVKATSRPGETYTLLHVVFKPTDLEIRLASETLRSDIYRQVSAEIERLSKLYPDQKYALHEINFMSQSDGASVMAREAMVFKSSFANNSVAPIMQVSNHQVMNASIIIAAAPGEDVLQLVHGSKGP